MNGCKIGPRNQFFQQVTGYRKIKVRTTHISPHISFTPVPRFHSAMGQALAKWMEFRAATRPKASVAAEQTACSHIKASEKSSALNEMIVLTAILKSARQWVTLRDAYEPPAIPKHGSVRH